MIIAIADDYSGAAELAGIALNLGLDTEIQTRANLQVKRDVVIIDTDTRSKPPANLRKVFKDLVGSISKYPPDWIYKKTDSVLRGHVMTELEFLLDGLQLEKCLLIPANPSQGRIITKGHYYIEGIPLDRTKFAEDPDYPAESSEISKILSGSEKLELHLFQKAEKISKPGIVVGESRSLDDIKEWITCVDDEVLLAGGSDFFKTALEFRSGITSKIESPLTYKPGNKRLIVSGTTSSTLKDIWSEVDSRRTPVCQIPCNLTVEKDSMDKCLDKWVRNICIALRGHHQVLAIVHQPIDHAIDVLDLFAKIVSEVSGQIDLDELVIEGGSTASRILRKLEWNRSLPINALSRGVVVLERVDKPEFKTIVKPGSYTWPKELWQYN